MTGSETPTGLAPSADSPAKKRKRLLAGKGLVLFIAGVGVCAACLYIFIVVYGVAASN